MIRNFFHETHGARKVFRRIGRILPAALRFFRNYVERIFKHERHERAGRRRREGFPPKAFANQLREKPDVVLVRVRKENDINALRVIRKPLLIDRLAKALPLREPAVDKNARFPLAVFCSDKKIRTRDAPRSAGKKNRNRFFTHSCTLPPRKRKSARSCRLRREGRILYRGFGK